MSSNTTPNTALPTIPQGTAQARSSQPERTSPSWGHEAWPAGVQVAQVSERAAAQQVRKSMLMGRRAGQGSESDSPVEQGDALTADRSAQDFDTASDARPGSSALGGAAVAAVASPVAMDAPNALAVSASEAHSDRPASLWGQEPATKSGTPSFFGGDHSSLYALLGGGLVLGAGVGAGGGGGSGSGGSPTSAGSGGTTTTQPLKVSVQDGYLANAQVYVDTNANGLADSNELVGTTDAKGQVTFDKSLVAGDILVIGGTNIDTGLPNTLTLKLASGTAFEGTVVINPLTTLVTDVMAQAALVEGNELTWAQASTLVKQALGIPDSVALQSFDPLSADHLNQADGLAVHKAAAQLATIASVNELAETAFTSLAEHINANRTATMDLADTDTLGAVLGESLAATVLADIGAANSAIASATTSAGVAAVQLSQATPVIVGLANDTGQSGSDLITSDTHLTVQGRNAQSLVEYSLDGGSTWSTYIDPAQDGPVTVVARLRYDTTTTPVYSGVSEPFTFELDSRTPSQPVVSLVNDTGTDLDLVTSDARLLISGLSDGAVLSVRIDNGEWQTLTPPSEGEPVAIHLGADGTHDVYVKQTYALNGGSAEQQISVTLDTQAQTGTSGLAANDPDADAENDSGRSKDDGITQNSRPVVVGHVEAGATSVTVEFAGEVFHLSLDEGLQADGSWQITPSRDLEDGSYRPVVTVTDAAGNTSAPTSLSVIVVDRTAPDASNVTAVLATGSDTGYADDDGLTSVNRPLIEGVAERGATVDVDVDGTVYTAQADAVTGAWSVQVTQALDDGEYTPLITVTDVAGNVSEAVEGAPFTVDASTPEVGLVGGLVLDDEEFDTGASASDGITANNLPLIQGEAEPGVVVVLKIGPQTFSTVVGDDGVWSFQLENELDDGTYTPGLTFLDAAGNVLRAKGETLVIDTEAPSEATADLVHDEENDTGAASDDGITANNSALLTGSAEAGSHILVDLNGTTFEADADEAGNWSLSLDGLDDGEYTPAITVIDLAGNVSDVIDGTPFVIDTQGPEAAEGAGLVHDDVSDTGIDTEDSLTANNQPVLTGTAEPGALLTIDLNGELFETTADDDGNWVLEVDRPLEDGEYTPVISVSDVAGNVTESEGATFTIDTEAPSSDTVSGGLQADEDNDTGLAADDGLTANNAPVLSGTADALALVKVEVDGSTYFTEADEDGVWSVQLDELPDGEYTPLITVTDAAGNEGDAIEGSPFSIDTSTPTEATAELLHDEDNDTGISADDGITANNAPTFNGTAEAGAHIVLDLNGTTFETDADEDGNWSLTAEGLDDGEYTPLITVVDAAGNSSDAIEGVAFVIDTEGPDAAEGGELTHDDVYDTGIDTSDGITANNQPVLTGTAAAGALVTVDLNGELFETTADDDGNWVLEVDRPLDDGEYTPVITVSDEAGNVTESEGVTFTIDTIAPSTDSVSAAIVADEDNDTGASQTDGITANNAPLLEGKADALAQVMVEVDGGTYITQADEDGYWTVELDALSDGDYTPVVTVIDAAGNEGTPVEGHAFTIDTEGPTEVAGGLQSDFANDTGVASDDGVTRNAQPTLAGEADPYSIVLLDLGTDVVYSATTDAQGHWSLKLPTALPDGEYVPVLSVTDLAGNTSDGVEIGTIVVDTTLAAFTGGLTSDEDNDTGVSAEDGITNNSAPTLSGTAEGGATIVVQLAGQRYETTADEEGVWTVAVSDDLADGTYTPQITVTDLAGNTGTHAGTAFTVDTVANIPGGDIGVHQAVLVGEDVDINVFGANAAYEGNTLEDYGGSLPDGLYIDDVTHHIKGTAEVAGVTWIAASTSDDAGNIATQYFQLAVSAREKSGVISINNANEETAATYVGSGSDEHMNLYSSAKDVLLAGAGDDLFQLYTSNDGAAYNFARLDGGEGFDIVKMYGASLDLDLSDFNNPDGSGRVMEHVEAIQFGDRDTSVTITAADLFHLRSDALDVDGVHSVVRLMAVATNGGSVTMDGLTQVGKDLAYGADGSLTDGKAGNLYSKFTGVYTDSNGDHLVELLLQKGLTAA